MAISNKLKQLIIDAHNIVRREENMAISIAVIDRRHSDDVELAVSSTGDAVSLICLAAKATSEALKQSNVSKRKMLKVLDQAIDVAEKTSIIYEE